MLIWVKGQVTPLQTLNKHIKACSSIIVESFVFINVSCFSIRKGVQN